MFEMNLGKENVIMDINTKPIKDKITKLCAENGNALIAIDGRCASGKTTLAERLRNELGGSVCNVFHMDDFFLRPEQRTAERLEEAGGNVDRERFLNEVLKPLSRGESVLCRPYSCKTGSFAEAVTINYKPINIVEGAYSCHPTLWDFYGLRIFLDVSSGEQLERVRRRNGEAALEVFSEKWIPLEERYFAAFDVADRCGIKICT